MFKALILSLALASGLHATVNNTTPIQNLDSGIHSPTLVPVGTPVYALNNALTGSASAAVDLSGTSGIWLHVTSTGAANVTVYFSNSAVSATGGAVSMYTINANGSYPIEPKCRYVSFYNSSNQASNRVSAYYYPVVTSPVTVNGTFSNGTVTAYQGGTWTMGISSGQGLSITSSPVFNAVSHSTYVVTTHTATVVNLSSAAGTVGRFTVGFAPSFGGAGVRLDYGTSATAPSDLFSVGAPIATSATAQIYGPFENGTIVYLQGSGSASVTGKLMIDQVK